MIAIVAQSGAGKDKLLKVLIKLGYNPIVSYTTRPPRTGEVDGVAYHFISEEKFIELRTQGFFAEWQQYRDWLYGTSKQDIYKPNSVVVVAPEGLRQLDKLFNNLTVVHVRVSEDERFSRLVGRRDAPQEIIRRLYADREDFLGIEDRADYIFDNEDDLSDEEFETKAIKFIEENIKGRK